MRGLTVSVVAVSVRSAFVMLLAGMASLLMLPVQAQELGSGGEWVSGSVGESTLPADLSLPTHLPIYLPTHLLLNLLPPLKVGSPKLKRHWCKLLKSELKQPKPDYTNSLKTGYR
ncbi:hypothetical protein C7B76_23340 [filamentous cyanobacterium CCP2]|nr:hypothetical protein C7B76_23340 [filamentous cyanobacterium CCP2]